MAKNNMGLKTKNKILDSAHFLFNEKGYDNVSGDEIAKRAGITKAIVYTILIAKRQLCWNW